MAARSRGVIERARATEDVAERIRVHVGGLRDLQYRMPPVNGVLLRQVPDSEVLMALCPTRGGMTSGPGTPGGTTECPAIFFRDAAEFLAQHGAPGRT